MSDRDLLRLLIEGLPAHERFIIDSLFYERISGMECWKRLQSEFPDKPWTYRMFRTAKANAYAHLRKALEIHGASTD